MTPRPESLGRQPRFTTAELKAIHRELFNVAWATEAFYDERRQAIKKLDDFFGDEKTHLKIITR